VAERPIALPAAKQGVLSMPTRQGPPNVINSTAISSALIQGFWNEFVLRELSK
jgi:hypothetical protein